MKKIFFITPYPFGQAPSQRFRYEQYLHFLKNDYKIVLLPFISVSTWKILYSEKKYSQKIFGVAWGYFNRFLSLFCLASAEFVFIHREASPLGPPVFEWIIAKILKRKIIYDFDDAIWISNTSSENKIVSMLKFHSKVSSICRWSYKVSVGNEYLRTYANQFNSKTVLNPTTIETEKVHVPKEHPELKGKLVIGWTGTHSTIKYLNELLPVFKNLEKQFDFELHVISNKFPLFNLKSLRYIPWSKSSEIEDLSKIDIGIMPLTQDVWSEGKCGFKALQYMALEKPTLASPIGVNQLIISDGVNGFFCSSQKEWEMRIIELLNTKELRTEMGKAGRQDVVKGYSVLSNRDNFLSLFS